MKLYYHPWACSLAPAIVAAEADIPLDYIHVDIVKQPHTLSDGTLYDRVNPRHYVPVLVRDGGQTLSEVSAILQYLADLVPGLLAPPPTSPERVDLQQWLTFIGTELHKMYSPWLFHPEVGAAAQDYARDTIANRFAFIERHLAGGREYLMERFTVADAYLFVPVNWAAGAQTPLTDYPSIRAWYERMKSRTKVRQALESHSAILEAVAS